MRKKRISYTPLLLAAALSLLLIGITAAQDRFPGMMGGSGMGGMTGMMQDMGNMMSGFGGMNFDADDIEWMKKMMGSMNLTDEEANEMTVHCPMMRGQ